jgi:predicted DNA-binding transcriptional regulator AlpA
MNATEAKSPQSPRFLTKRELAKLYQLSTRTIDNFLADGLPHLAIGYRTVRMEEGEARQWITERYEKRRNGL